MMRSASCRKAGRLTEPSEYRRVYKKGRLLKEGALWLCCLLNGTDRDRIGISIGRGAIKKSTIRNRLKRIIREWFRQQDTKAAGGGLDIIVTVTEQINPTGRGSKNIRQALSGLLNKSNRFRSRR